MKKAVCKICQNYQAEAQMCVAPRNMFALRGKNGMECRALRSPAELNKNQNCAWFDKIPLTTRLLTMLGLKKPQSLSPMGA
jgi:hypothetical protein